MRKFSKKTVALVVSIALLLCVGIGTTLAYLVDVTGPVTNTFEPSQVSTWVYEEIEGNVKKNVKIQNTGDIDANIRAAIVVTWQNADGDVLGQVPEAKTDYKIDLGSKWNLVNGYYVYKDVVAPNDLTENLINSCEPLKPAPVDGYYLCVEIIASGIQVGGITGAHPWGI